MRLTDEQIMDIKEYLNRSIKITISSLIPRISKHGLDLIDTIKALQQENEQLRAQVARMRETLKEIFELLEEHEPIWYLRKHYNLITAALSDTPAEYHNPADVEALRKAKKFLDRIYPADVFTGESGDEGALMVVELRKAIDKAIGGKEDV